MNFSLHREADEEFIKAVAYYEECASGLGLDFSREVYACTQNAIDYMAFSSSPSCTCTATQTTGNTDRGWTEQAAERHDVPPPVSGGVRQEGCFKNDDGA